MPSVRARSRQMTARGRALRSPEASGRRGPNRTAEWVVGRALRSPGADFSAVRSSEWRNRQTRQLEGLVPERAWGFKSPLRHDLLYTEPHSQRSAGGAGPGDTGTQPFVHLTLRED